MSAQVRKQDKFLLCFVAKMVIAAFKFTVSGLRTRNVCQFDL